MGHGNPDEYDTYKANIRYTLLEYSNVRALYKTHTRQAETVDFYHSMFPEE